MRFIKKRYTATRIFFCPNSFWVIIFLLGTYHACIAQQNDSLSHKKDSTVIDVAKIRFQKIISKQCLFSITAKNEINDTTITLLPFTSGPFLKNTSTVSSSYIEKDIYFKFTLCNSSDSAKPIYFMPSRYCKNISLFQAEPGNISETFRKIPDSLVRSQRFAGCKVLTIPSKDTLVFFTRFQFLRTNVNVFSPRLIELDYLNQALRDMKQKYPMLDIITYIASGILLLMIFYSLAAYMQYHNIEFIYYSAYAFCSALLLFSKAYLNIEHTAFNFFTKNILISLFYVQVLISISFLSGNFLIQR